MSKVSEEAFFAETNSIMSAIPFVKSKRSTMLALLQAHGKIAADALQPVIAPTVAPPVAVAPTPAATTPIPPPTPQPSAPIPAPEFVPTPPPPSATWE